MIKKKHNPIRTCVACRSTDEKRELLRVVRDPEGKVQYDPKGKLSGRGAYVCSKFSCIALARKQKKLERSLKVTTLPEELFATLNAVVSEGDAMLGHEVNASDAMLGADAHASAEPVSDNG